MIRPGDDDIHIQLRDEKRRNDQLRQQVRWGKKTLLFSLLMLPIAYFSGHIDIFGWFSSKTFPDQSQPEDDLIKAPPHLTIHKETTPDFTLQEEMTPTMSISQNTQTLMRRPKTIPYAEQMTLQDRLITACKQGDEKAVKSLLEQGAQPILENKNREQPLGAAVWGMNPAVVDALITKNGGVAPMNWAECQGIMRSVTRKCLLCRSLFRTRMTNGVLYCIKSTYLHSFGRYI